MKIGILLGTTLLFILLVLVNQKREISSNKSEKKDIPAVQAETSQDEKVWIPEQIEKCVAQIDAGEPLEMATSINPFYLRADFDGNGSVDYAVLVQGQRTKKRGVVICKDSKEAFIFGAISKLATPVSSFEDDNFITQDWEIMTKEETRNISLSLGKSRVGVDAKGESVAFIFEGGSLFIYWNGRTFRVVEGA